MKKLNFAIIGCGRISHKILNGLVKNEEKVILKAIVDPIKSKMDILEEKAKESFEKKSDVAKYKEVQEMIKKEKIDVAIISTESGYHEKIALDCLEAGINVIIEKPIAMSIKGAELLIDKAKEKNLKLGACHQNRFNYPIQLLHQAIKEEKMGRIYNGTARILWTRDESYYNQAPWRGTWKLDGGTLMNQCIHNIDLLNWMLGGDVESVYAQTANFARNIEGEDYGAIIIRYKSGKIGIVEGTVTTYPKNLEETLSITGSKGTVVIGGISVNKVNTWKIEGENEEKYLGIDCGDPNCVYGYGHEALIKDFIEAVENDRPPLVNGEEGMEAMKIILAAYKSQKTGLPVKFDDFKEFSTLDMEKVNIKVR